MKVLNLGQVFTPNDMVDFMISLRKNNGTILEPSAGEGAFSDKLPGCVSIELDETLSDKHLNIDFFDYSEDNKFDTIIGNPPYVDHKNILEETSQSIHKIDYLSSFDHRTNLYIYFIAKCVHHLDEGGELIMITPRNFIKATSASKLNRMFFELGTITDWYEYGDENVFGKYTPNVSVWRFEKGNYDRKVKTRDGEKKFVYNNGQISFISKEYSVKFSDLFYVKVGAASGMDEVFAHPDGNQEFVCSYTKSKGELKTMYYNVINSHIKSHKEDLLKRKIKSFNESNWWQWGRHQYESSSDRIYVNCKTRDPEPFFTHECKYFDGAILGIFPKYYMNVEKAAEMLNKVDWDDLGFKIGTRFFFMQKSLENCYLPKSFNTLRQNQIV